MSKAYCWVHTLPTQIYYGIQYRTFYPGGRAVRQFAASRLLGLHVRNSNVQCRSNLWFESRNGHRLLLMGMDVCHLSGTLVNG